MFGLNDVTNIENGADTEEDAYASLQRAINSLDAWRLQGSYGRAMMEAIESGSCMLGESGTRDYWGNYVPSRTEVKAGTKGSYDFVVNVRGAEWADAMAKVDDDDA